jgi:hypothetical protein
VPAGADASTGSTISTGGLAGGGEELSAVSGKQASGDLSLLKLVPRLNTTVNVVTGTVEDDALPSVPLNASSRIASGSDITAKCEVSQVRGTDM